MSSPGPASGTTRPAVVFEELWRQLRECHENTLKELEAKVSKLKKERCLDAQRLEVFYNRNQQLKEQNKMLQDAMSLLEERLRTGVCDQCNVLEENLKSNQEQNLHLINKLKHERNSLEDENRRLQAALEKLAKARSSEPQQTSSPELEDGIIPDSPVMPSSLPAANKLKKRKNVDQTKRVRYAETPLAQSRSLIFDEPDKEPVDALKNPGRAEVLVPNTCELDTSQILKNAHENPEEEVAETCRLDLLDLPYMKREITASQQRTSLSSWKSDVHLKPFPTLSHSPDSTTETTHRSPSLLPLVRRVSTDGSVNRAKRKKEDADEEDKGGGVEKRKESQHMQPELMRQSFEKKSTDSKVQPALEETSSQTANVSCTSPTFKKPKMKELKRTPLQDRNAALCQPDADDDERTYKLEPMWSIDPALALSMYDSEWRGDEESQHCRGESVDTDCTWISHSLLQRRTENSQDTNDEAGLGEKANDSLDKMFDATDYGEYKSYNSPHLGRSQSHEEDEDEDDEQDDAETSFHQRKTRQPTFAHVAVVRKKDERRKLKGTTCKECEIYYAHLPEDEKQKKLSACSRHRFLYIPPCTPENFWEVGFPSTQTCIDRGYVKEEKNPQARLRRRQPFNALFSPKRNQQENQK